LQTSAGQQDATGGATDHSATAAFCIGRLLAIAAIYPAGHPRCVEIEDQVLAACQQCGPLGLVLKVSPQGLFTPDGELSLGDANFSRLHDTLHTLAIVSLRIDGGVSAEDLRRFVSTLQRVKASTQRSTGFSRPDLSGQLPDTIQVAHREFGGRLVSESVAATIHGARAAMLQHLRGVAPPDDLSTATELVGTIVARIVERVEQGGPLTPADRSTRGRALDSVLDLCAHAMKHAIEQMLAAGEPLDELASLVQNVEKAVALGQDRQSVEALLDVLRLAADESQAQPDPKPEGADEAHVACEQHALTFEQLESQLAALAPDPRPFVSPAVEQQEQLTIQLQLALHAQPPQLLRVATALRSCRAADWGPAEFRILTHGCVDFAAKRDVTLVDLFVPTLCELARNVPGQNLDEFLLALCSSIAAPATRVRLWPHVVNELLHRATHSPDADRGDAEDEDKLWARLLTIAGPDQAPYIKRLLRLDFVLRGRLPATVLDAATPLRSVLVALLGSPEGDALGRHLFQELRQGAAQWPGWQALLALPRYDSNARLLVQEALRAGHEASESHWLQHQSAQILATALAYLPKERRGEPWIPAALAALGEQPDAACAAALAAVLRRRLFWPQWPSSCRRAARNALRQHRLTSHGEP
jgi:hypothetical protein